MVTTSYLTQNDQNTLYGLFTLFVLLHLFVCASSRRGEHLTQIIVALYVKCMFVGYVFGSMEAFVGSPLLPYVTAIFETVTR